MRYAVVWPAMAAMAGCLSPQLERSFGASSLMADIELATRPYQSLAGYDYTDAGNQISVVPAVGTDAVWDHARDAIAAANRQVLLQSYQWELGSYAEAQVLEGLRRLGRAHQPDTTGVCAKVKVRILIDRLDLPIIGDEAHEEVKAAITGAGLDLTCLDIAIGAYNHESYDNLHSKTVIVDQSAIITGANVQSVHDGEPAVCIEGPAACGLTLEFADAWSHVGPVSSLSGDPTTLDDCVERSEPLHCEASFGPMFGTEGVPILITGRPGNGTLLDSSGLFPDDLENSQDAAFLAAIDGAQSTIKIATPNLNDNHIREALRLAVERGLSVKILLGYGMNDSGEQYELQGCNFFLDLDFLKDLYDPFRNLYPWDRINMSCPPRTNLETVNWFFPIDDTLYTCTFLDIRWYVDADGNLVDGNSSATQHQLHAKYMSIDDHIAIVGSANLDNRSIDGSREVNIVVDSSELVARWDEAVFAPRWGYPGAYPPNTTVNEYWRTCSSCGDGMITGGEECDYCGTAPPNYASTSAECDSYFTPGTDQNRRCHEELTLRGRSDPCAGMPELRSPPPGCGSFCLLDD